MSIYNYNQSVFPPAALPTPPRDYGYGGYPWASCYRQSPPPSTAESTSDGTATTEVSESGFTVALKVLSPRNKRDYRQYSLRNVVPTATSTPELLREVIRSQVGEVVSETTDFPVGFYQESKKIWIQNKQDLLDAWRVLEKSKSLTLWCHGRDTHKRKKHDADLDAGHNDAAESDDEGGRSMGKRACTAGQKKTRSTSEEKAMQVQELKGQLEQKHGTKYSGCQYRLWAEMLFAGVHKDMDEAPQVPMFDRGTPRKRTSSSGTDLSNALTDVAVAIKNAFNPPSPSETCTPTSTRSTYSSPRKAADLRSRYIQQLKELASLREIGALTSEEYEAERVTVVKLMRELHAQN